MSSMSAPNTPKSDSQRIDSLFERVSLLTNQVDGLKESVSRLEEENSQLRTAARDIYQSYEDLMGHHQKLLVRFRDVAVTQANDLNEELHLWEEIKTEAASRRYLTPEGRRFGAISGKSTPPIFGASSAAGAEKPSPMLMFQLPTSAGGVVTMMTDIEAQSVGLSSSKEAK